MADATRRDNPDETPTCLLCGRRNPDQERVDTRCRGRVLEWLAALPALHRRLGVELVPGSAAGERVSSSAPGSRPAVAMAVLSLVAGSSRLLAEPVWRRPAGWTPEEADLPIGEFVAGWAAAWRQRHGHHRPSLVDARPTAAPEVPGAPPRPDLRDADGDLLPPDVVRRRLAVWARDLAAWQARRVEAAGEGARVVLGLGPADRPDDPLVEKLAHRFGDAPAAYRLGTDCGYLATWFDRVCDDRTHPEEKVEAFLGGLRALVNRARAALGERSDLVFLGRCPETLRMRDEHGDEVEEYCGCRLWQDPYTGRYVNGEQVGSAPVVCRRCHAEWPPERWLWLCARIREVWPDDSPSRRTWEAAS